MSTDYLNEAWGGLRAPNKFDLYVRVCHHSAENPTMMGKFVFSDKNIPPQDTITLILLGMQSSRAYWSVPQSRGRPDCASPDGEVAYNGRSCQDCPLRSRQEKNMPFCQERLNIIALLPMKANNEISLRPILWQLSGKNRTELRDWLYNIIKVHHCDTRKYLVTVGLTQTIATGMVRYSLELPTVQQLTPVPDHLLNEVMDKSLSLLSMVKEQVRQQPVEMQPDVDGEVEPEYPSLPTVPTAAPAPTVPTAAPAPTPQAPVSIPLPVDLDSLPTPTVADSTDQPSESSSTDAEIPPYLQKMLDIG